MPMASMVMLVDYRHVIHAPKCKPMKLLGPRYRDQLFPGSRRRNLEALMASPPAAAACRSDGRHPGLAHEQAVRGGTRNRRHGPGRPAAEPDRVCGALVPDARACRGPWSRSIPLRL